MAKSTTTSGPSAVVLSPDAYNAVATTRPKGSKSRSVKNFLVKLGRRTSRMHQGLSSEAAGQDSDENNDADSGSDDDLDERDNSDDRTRDLREGYRTETEYEYIKHGDEPYEVIRERTSATGQDLLVDETAAAVSETCFVDSAQMEDALAPTASAPYGYRVVTVRDQDGKVLTVKRPLEAEEAVNTELEERQVLLQLENSSAGPGTTSHTETSAETLASATIRVDTKAADLVTKGVTPTRHISIQEKEVKSPTTPPDRRPTRQDTNISTVSENVRSASRVGAILMWAVMVAFPVLFLALGIATAAHNNKVVKGSEGGMLYGKDTLTQVREVAVSMWPIVFAAIMAQTFRAYASYKIERGMSLMTLEQLINSNSVASAIKQPFVLRKFNLTSIILFSFWALSPLAGQAIVRMMRTDPLPVLEELTVSYFAPQTMNYENMEFAEVPATNILHVSQVDAMYTSLLIGNNGSRWAPQDFWTNVKIPAYNKTMADDGITQTYNNVSAFDGDIEYAGLSGIPVWIPEKSVGQNLTFDIVTSYYILDCSDFVSLEASSDQVQSLNLTSSTSGTLYLSAENGTTLYANHTTKSDPYQGPGANGVIHFGSVDQTRKFGDGDRIFYSRCAYDQILMRSTLKCRDGGELSSCLVTKQSPVQDPSTTSFKPLGLYFAEIMRSCGGNAINSSTVTETEQYVKDPAFASAKDFWNPSQGLAGVTGAQMSKNFGVLVNTLWMAGTKHKALLGGNLTQVWEYSNHVFPLTYVDTTAQTDVVRQYKVNWPWCVVLIICSILLLVGGVVAAILEGRTIGPDFLGFANTAVRKGVRLPKHMNNLNARDRLEALHEAEVLLQDVRPDDDRGRIALGIKDESSVRLVRGRTYR